MPAAHRLCCEETRHRGEPLPGLGGPVQPHLLLTWPRRKWADHVFIARDMDPAIAERLERLREAGYRIQLIDRRDCDHAMHRLVAMPSGDVYEAPGAALPDLLDALHDGGDAAVPWLRARTGAIWLLCCTHGRVDRCCAKFGHATYRAVAAAAAEHGDRFEVWECSHVGGCRLAANVVVLPGLRRYGRVLPEQAPALLAAEAGGRPFLPCYRGIAGLNTLEQCAGVAALEWLERAGHEADITVLPHAEPETSDEAEVRVRWSGVDGDGELAVACASAELEIVGNCGHLETGERSCRLAWRAETVWVVTGRVREAP